jgi:hypothetical protein
MVNTLAGYLTHQVRETKASEGSQRRREGLVWFPISLLFFGAQLLLPVERGFTVMKLLGAPIYLPMIINVVGIVLLLFWFPKQTFMRSLSKPWVVLNLIFAAFCFFTSLLSTDWQTSLFYSYLWISNFVFSFLIVDLLFQKIKLKGLILVICTVAVFQIAIGILEGFFQIRLPIYELASVRYLSSMGAVVSGERGNSWDSRVLGSLGDPILFGTVLMLLIPFLVKVNQRFLRFVLIGVVSLLALMTLSRTVLLFFGCYLAVYFYRSSLSQRVIATVALLATFVVIFNVNNSLANEWSERFQEELLAPETGGVAMRESMAIQAIEDGVLNSDLWSVLCGHGFYSSKEIGGQYLQVSTTIDDAYVTVLYENGLIGLILYLLICFLPFRNTSRGRENHLLVAGYVGILLCGFSFVTYRVFSVNLLAMTILVAMTSRDLNPRIGQVAKDKKTHRPAKGYKRSPNHAFALLP